MPSNQLWILLVKLSRKCFQQWKLQGRWWKHFFFERIRGKLDNDINNLWIKCWNLRFLSSIFCMIVVNDFEENNFRDASLLVVPNNVSSWWEYQFSQHEKMSCEGSGFERGRTDPVFFCFLQLLLNGRHPCLIGRYKKTLCRQRKKQVQSKTQIRQFGLRIILLNHILKNSYLYSFRQ